MQDTAGGIPAVRGIFAVGPALVSTGHVLRWSDLFPGCNVTRSLLCPLSLSSHPCRTRPVRLWVSPCVGEEPLPTIAPERNSVTDYTSHDPPLPQPPSLNCTLKPFKPYKCVLHISETYSNAVFNCFLISCNICVKWFWQYTMLLCNKLLFIRKVILCIHNAFWFIFINIFCY